MNIHKLYGLIFRVWRARRMKLFERIIRPRPDEILLDVGGYAATWTPLPQQVKRIDCLNVHPVSWDSATAPNHTIALVLGDGCALDYADQSYDILFSNSVIEHVGDWNRQSAFASECRRVGKRIWVQTPAYECPIEPHYLAFGVHWLPAGVQRRILRWFSLWGWISKPDQSKIDEMVATTHLLTKKQVQELFPDCTIMTERLFGVFRKSYIAYRG